MKRKVLYNACYLLGGYIGYVVNNSYTLILAASTPV